MSDQTLRDVRDIIDPAHAKKAEVKLADLKCTGVGFCTGGKHPNPPLHGYDLLAWMPAHAKHKDCVFTEDQRASVEEIALELAVTPNVEVIAAKFGTTPEHVAQAIDYAVKAGFIS